MPRLLALVGQGVLRPAEAVTRHFALAEVDDAYRALDARAIVGRAIVTMPS
jgi:hypothetical protein